jgi:hypothetical protein
MKIGLSMKSHAEVTKRYAKAYVKASKGDKGRILDDVVAVTGGRVMAPEDSPAKCALGWRARQQAPRLMRGSLRNQDDSSEMSQPSIQAIAQCSNCACLPYWATKHQAVVTGTFNPMEAPAHHGGELR